MVWIAFGFKRWRYFVNGLLTLYLSTFIAGGALIGVHYFIQYDPKLTENVLISSVKGFGDPITWFFVMLGFPAAWHFAKNRFDRMEIAKINYDQLVSVAIRVDEKDYNFTGMIDSGNQVYDPISKMPVMFVSINKKRNHLPEDIIQLAEESEEIIMGQTEISGEWQNRLRIIPCKVVGKDHQLVTAIKPDLIIVTTKEEQIFCEKGLISFTAQQLSSEDAFECIVHPKMLTGHRQAINEPQVS